MRRSSEPSPRGGPLTQISGLGRIFATVDGRAGLVDQHGIVTPLSLPLGIVYLWPLRVFVRSDGPVLQPPLAPSAAIGIMCKAPRPGSAKTRLAAMIGPEAAAALSACFLRDVAAAIEAVPASLGRQGYGVYAPAGAEAELRQVMPASFSLLLQADCEFGNVLHGAVHDLLMLAHDCVVLVNSDSPTLPSSLLVDAITALRRPGDRMMLGPAMDGGYYLIGLKHAHRHLFTGIPWGTDAVAELTLQRAAEVRLETVLLPEWYDIDDAETLSLLQDELAGRPTPFVGGGPAASTRGYFSTVAAAQ